MSLHIKEQPLFYVEEEKGNAQKPADVTTDEIADTSFMPRRNLFPKPPKGKSLQLKVHEARLVEVNDKGNISIKYGGYANEDVRELLLDLRNLNKKSFSAKALDFIRVINNRIDGVVQRTMTFEQWDFSVCKEDILLWLFILPLAIVYTVQLISLRDESDKFESDSWEITLLEWFPALNIVFSVILLVLLIFPIISIVCAVILLLMLASVIMAITVAIVGSQEGSESFLSTGVWFKVAFSGICGAIYLFYYGTYKLIDIKAGRLVARFFIAFTYGLIYYWFFYSYLKQAVKQTSFSIEGATLLKVLKGPILLTLDGVLLVFWAFLHKVFFLTSRKKLYQIIAKALQLALKTFSREYVESTIAFPAVIKTLLRSSYLIASFIHCGLFVTIMHLSMSRLFDGLIYSNSNYTYMSIFSLLAVPCGLFATIAFNISTMPVKNKLLVAPLVSMGMLIGVYRLKVYLFEQSTEWQYLGYLFWVGIPLYLLYMCSLAMYKMSKKRFIYAIMSVSALFIFFPGFLMLPVADVYYQGDSNWTIVGTAMMGTGTLILVSIAVGRFFYDLVHFCKHRIKRIKTGITSEDDILEEEDEQSLKSIVQEEDPDKEEDSKEDSRSKDQSPSPGISRIITDASPMPLKIKSNYGLDFKNAIGTSEKEEAKKDDKKKKKKVTKELTKLDLSSMINLNLKDTGFWFNTMAFAGSYTIIITFFWDSLVDDNNTFNMSDTEKGIIYTLLGVIPFFFLAFNFLIRLRTSKVSKSEINSISHKIIVQIQAGEDPELLKKEHVRRIQRTIAVFGLLIVPIGLIGPSIALNSAFGSLCQGIIGCTVIFSVILLGLIELKKSCGTYHKFLIPTMVIVAWLALIIPFGIIAPAITIFISNENAEFYTALQAFVFVGGIEFVLGVTIMAIVINVILNKAELEKKARYVIKRMMTMMKKNGVKSEYTTLRRIYDAYRRQTKDELLIEGLNDGYPVFWWDIGPNEHDFNYNKILVTREAYMKLLKRKNEPPKQVKKGCCQKIHEQLFGTQAEEMFAEANIQDMELLDEKQRWKVDDLFPKGSKLDQIFKPLNEILGDDFDDIKRKQTPLLAIDPKDIVDRKHDFDKDGLMYNRLQTLKIQPLGKYEEKAGLFADHARVLRASQKARDQFIKHIYDYFMGTITFEETPYKGLLYKDFERFLEIAGLQGKGVKNIDTKAIYHKYAYQPEDNLSFTLSLEDFKHSLIDMYECLGLNTKKSDLNDIQKLEKIIKKVYQNIMVNLPDINKNYKINIRLAVGEEEEYDDMKFPEPISAGIESVLLSPSTVNAARYLERRKTNLQQDIALMLPPAPPQKYNKEEGQPDEEPVDELELQKKQERNRRKSLRLADQEYIKKRYHSIKKVGFWRKCFGSRSKQGTGLISRTMQKIRKGFRNFAEVIGFDVAEPDEDPEDELFNKQQMRRPLTPWHTLVDITVVTIHAAEGEYERFAKKETVGLTLSLANINAIISKIINIYNMSSFAFRDEIKWFPKDSVAADIIKAPVGDMLFNNTFIAYFWLSFALGLIYLYLVSTTLKKVKDGTLGLDKNGKPARPPSKEFFQAFVLSILGNTLFTMIVKSLLNSLTCHYDSATKRAYLVASPNMTCLETQHKIYFFTGIVGLVIYYPISCIFYPNFQFKDRSLDIKYEPYFVVILVQFKFVISQSASFFASNDITDTTPARNQLITHIILFCTLAMLSYYSKPCLVRKMVVWDTALYLIGAFVNVSSLVVYYTEQGLIGLMVLVPGTLLILIITAYIYKRYYIKTRFKTRIVHDRLKFSVHKVQAENIDLALSRKIDAERWKEYDEKQQMELQEMVKDRNNRLRMF